MAEEQLGTAQTWRLKGAGNANLVFSYHGTDPSLEGLVLRVRKLPNWTPHRQTEDFESQAAERLDAELWRNILADPDAAEGGALSREELYALRCLTRWIDACYIPRGVPCTAPAALAPALEPFRAVVDPAIPPQLFLDHTVFQTVAGGLPDGWKPAGPTVCAEIKPKAGCMAPSTYLSPGTVDLKAAYPRFMMHTLLKAVQGQGQLSGYNPVDLFSQAPERVRRALGHLLATPNNNMRLFVAGAQLWGDAADAKAVTGSGHHDAAAADLLSSPAEPLEVDTDGARAASRLQQLGGQLSQAGFEFAPAVLIAALQEVLCKEGLLAGVLAAQEQDALDVEGALPAFVALRTLWAQRLAAGGTSVETAGSDVWQGFDEPHVMELLRGYLTAVTLKDCGVMVTLQHVQPTGAAGNPPRAGSTGSVEAGELADAVARLAQLCRGSQGLVQVAATTNGGDSLHFRYKITLLDLDLKSVTKIPSHAKLDAQLVACARQHPGLLAKLLDVSRTLPPGA